MKNNRLGDLVPQPGTAPVLTDVWFPEKRAVKQKVKLCPSSFLERKLRFCVSGERFRVHILRLVTNELCFFLFFFMTLPAIYIGYVSLPLACFHIHFEATHSTAPCVSVCSEADGATAFHHLLHGNVSSLANALLLYLFF